MKNVTYVGPRAKTSPVTRFTYRADDGERYTFRKGQALSVPDAVAAECLAGDGRAAGHIFTAGLDGTVPDLKKLAKDEDVDITGLTRKQDIIDRIEAARAAKA